MCRNCKNCKSCSNRGEKKCIGISKSSFGCCGDRTYEITHPGKYCLNEDVEFCPQYKNMSAIVIKSSDVILDLCGHVLEQGNSVTSVIGILVKENCNNVTILGSYGTIEKFSQLGISVEGNNKYLTIGGDKPLTVTGCGGGTPLALMDNNRPQFQGGIRIGSNKNWEIKGFSSYVGSVDEVTISNLNCDGNNPNGAIFGNGFNWKIKDSSFSKNSATRPEGAGLFNPPSPDLRVDPSCGWVLSCAVK